MKKRPISVGRRQVQTEGKSSAQTERVLPSSFDEVIVSLQSKLQLLEQKYTAFVTRCITMLKERKSILTTRISGEGGVVDDGFRLTISELITEKDRIEEDIQYMLDLKENSHRKGQNSSSGKALLDALKVMDRYTTAARDHLLSLLPMSMSQEVIQKFEEVFGSLNKALQSSLISFNNAKTQQTQDFVQQIKTLQAEKAGLESLLKRKVMESADEYQTQIMTLRQTNLNLEEHVRDLSNQLQIPSSPTASDDMDSPRFGTPQLHPRRVDSSPIRTSPCEADVSRLKRKLIAVSKERDLLKVWKQNHVNMSPPAMATMQQLRTDLAAFTERCQAQKTYYSDKLRGLILSAEGFLSASEKLFSNFRDKDSLRAWDQSKGGLLCALRTSSLQPKDLEIMQNRKHIGVQICLEDRIPMEDLSKINTEHIRLLNKVKATEDALLAEKTESAVIAKAKSDLEAMQGREADLIEELRTAVGKLTLEKQTLQQQVSTLTGQQRKTLDLIEDCKEMKCELSMLQDRCTTSEKEKKTLSDKLQVEKVSKERLRVENDGLKLERHEVSSAVQEIADMSVLHVAEMEPVNEELKELLKRVTIASGHIEQLRAVFSATSSELSQVRKAAETQLQVLKKQLLERDSEIAKLQSKFSVSERDFQTTQKELTSKSIELSNLLTSKTAFLSQIKGLESAKETLRSRVLELEKGLEDVETQRKEAEEELQREKEVSGGLLDELQNARKRLTHFEQNYSSAVIDRKALERLQIMTQEHDREKKELTEQVKCERDAFAQKSKAIESLRNEVDTCKLSNSGLQTDLISAKAAIEQRDQELSRLLEELSDLKETGNIERVELARKVRDMEARLEHMEEEKMDLESYIDAQNRNIRETESEMQETMEKLRLTQSELKQIATMLNTEETSIVQVLAERLRVHSSITFELQEAGEWKSMVRSQIWEIGKKMERFGTVLGDTSTDEQLLANMTLQIDQGLVQISTLESANRALQMKIDKEKEALNGLQISNSDSQTAMEHLSKSLEVAKHQINQGLVRISTLESANRTLQVKINQYQEDLCVAYERLQMSQADAQTLLSNSLQLADLQINQGLARISALESANKTLQVTIAQDKEALHSAQKRLQISNTDSQTAMEHLSNDLEVAKHQINQGLVRISVLESTNRALQVSIDKHQEDLFFAHERFQMSQVDAQSTLEHLSISLQLAEHQTERANARLEDLSSTYLRSLESFAPLFRMSLDFEAQQSDLERQRDELMQKFATEKLELLASSEAEIQYLSNQLSKQKTDLLPIAAENRFSDVEIVHEGSGELVMEENRRESVREETDLAAETGDSLPNRAFYTLYRDLCAHAESVQVDVTEVINTMRRNLDSQSFVPAPFSIGTDTRATQTSLLYRELPSNISMEEDISAVAGALRPHDDALDQTGSFEQREYGGMIEGSPSFEVSLELHEDVLTPKSNRLPELPLRSALRPIQTESAKESSIFDYYKNVEKDLEDEIRTNKLMQQQIQLLKQEIQQKERQLMRISVETKALFNPEILKDAFLKLVKTLPQL